MKKFYSILIIAIFTHHLTLQTMEQKASSLSSLPRDVKLVITRLVAGDEEKKIAAKNFAALGSVNKEFNTLYGQVMELHPLYKTGFSYFHYKPLSIGNVKAEFEKAQRLNEVPRIEECMDFINEYRNEILIPSWRYFAKKSFMEDHKCDTLADQIIQNKLPKKSFEGADYSKIILKRGLYHAIQRRQDLCCFCKMASVMNLIVGLWIFAMFCPNQYYQ